MGRSERNRLPLWTFPLLAVFLVALWQSATVSANYGGNWTALYCAGDLQRLPPLAGAENVYLFQNSTGYDGQFYHYIAHDPFLRTNLKTFVDDARFRYRRILVPLLAYLLAGGRSGLIDPAYELVFLIGIGLGVYWCCRFAQSAGMNAAWGMLFLAMPAIPVTMDRLVTDGGLAVVTAAFLWFSRSPSWKLFVVLVCAALTRETGFLLVLGYCGSLAWRRQFGAAGVFLLSAVPALAWYGYVQTRTTGKPLGISLVPFSGFLYDLANPKAYPPGTPFAACVRVADYSAIAGMVVAIGLALVWFARRPSEPVRIAAMLFATMAIVVQRTDYWQNAFDIGRVYTPLFLCLGGIAAEYRNVWLLAPVAMILPRVGIQFVPQILGVLR